MADLLVERERESAPASGAVAWGWHRTRAAWRHQALAAGALLCLTWPVLLVVLGSLHVAPLLGPVASRIAAWALFGTGVVFALLTVTAGVALGRFQVNQTALEQLLTDAPIRAGASTRVAASVYVVALIGFSVLVGVLALGAGVAAWIAGRIAPSVTPFVVLAVTIGGLLVEERLERSHEWSIATRSLDFGERFVTAAVRLSSGERRLLSILTPVLSVGVVTIVAAPRRPA